MGSAYAMDESDTAAVVVADSGSVLMTVNGYGENGGGAIGSPVLHFFDQNTTSGATAGAALFTLVIGDYTGSPGAASMGAFTFSDLRFIKGLTVLLVPNGNTVSLVIEHD